MMIVAGIPTCIGTVGFILNYKFCQHYDEEQDANIGGYTICECITYVLTCGKAMQRPEPEKDEFMERYKNLPIIEEEEEMVELETNDTSLKKKKKPSTELAELDKVENPV